MAVFSTAMAETVTTAERNLYLDVAKYTYWGIVFVPWGTRQNTSTS
jgi:hypothetical protein